MIYPARLRQSRSLTVIERTIAAVTMAIAVATVTLAVAHTARASDAGVLPLYGAPTSAPATVISHVEVGPSDR